MPELWTGIPPTQRNGRKKKMEEKVLLFFIRMDSNTVILLNTNVFTCYL